MINLRTKQEGKLVDPVVFGSHMHWVIYKRNNDGSIAKTIGKNGRVLPIVLEAMPVCDLCRLEDDAFDMILADKGSDYVARRITKRESYRLYDRKWPYDMTSKAAPLESVQDTLGQESHYEENMIADELVAEFKATLTPLQVWMLGKFEAGYHPRDVAVMRGKSQSKSEAERWAKNNIKKKFVKFMEDQE